MRTACSRQALTISILFVLNNFIKKRFMTKSSDQICDLFKAQASRPYSNTGTHLLLTNNSLYHANDTRYVIVTMKGE